MPRQLRTTTWTVSGTLLLATSISTLTVASASLALFKQKLLQALSLVDGQQTTYIEQQPNVSLPHRSLEATDLVDLFHHFTAIWLILIKPLSKLKLGFLRRGAGIDLLLLSFVDQILDLLTRLG